MRWFLLLSLLTSPLPAFAQSTNASPEAFRVYEEGKRLYDAKDFAGALQRFDQAAALEPGSARWQYNRGLALKKLDRSGEAVGALREARRLDPEYKHSEIDEKLAELGAGDLAAAPPTGRHTGRARPPVMDFEEAAVLLVGLLVLFGIGLHGWRSRTKARSAGTRRAGLPVDAAALAALATRNDAVSARITRVEHAMSLGEDLDARANLDRAVENLKLVRKYLATVARGDDSLTRATEALARADDSSRAAEQKLRALRGAAFDTAKGERRGCFFCARPLATPRVQLSGAVREGGRAVEVTVCASCERRLTAGQAPKVVTIGGQHWSAVAEFDPYVHAFRPFPNQEETPAWKLGGFGAIAAVAGGAVLGGVAVAALLDLDAVREHDLANAASQASARSAGARRQERDWKDHS